MENTKKVIEGMEALQRSISIHQCYTCSYEFIDAANEFGTTIVSEAIELLKEQEKEIKQLRLALDIMKGKGVIVNG